MKYIITIIFIGITSAIMAQSNARYVPMIPPQQQPIYQQEPIIIIERNEKTSQNPEMVKVKRYSCKAYMEKSHSLFARSMVYVVYEGNMMVGFDKYNIPYLISINASDHDYDPLLYQHPRSLNRAYNKYVIGEYNEKTNKISFIADDIEIYSE